MTPTARQIVTPVVRALGAFHTGVAVYLITPRLPVAGPGWHLPHSHDPLVYAVLAAVGVFAAGHHLPRAPSTLAVVSWGYLAPLAAVCLIDLLAARPPDWAAAVAQAREFLAAVVKGTPVSVYAACLAFGLLTWRRAADAAKGFYR